MKDLADIRKDYQLAALDESSVGDDPVAFFVQWFIECQKSEVDEVNAMTLATVDSDQRPDARIVLLKGVEDGGFIFFTNYNSTKGINIAHNPHVSLVFFWKELERQVRIQGVATKLTSARSDEYFKLRPTGSKIGAWASPQSTVIPNRDTLQNSYSHYEKALYGEHIPRPEHWGGYIVMPDTIEFWQGRASRLHDRIRFTAQGDGMWIKNRLAP